MTFPSTVLRQAQDDTKRAQDDTSFDRLRMTPNGAQDEKAVERFAASKLLSAQ